MTFSDCGQYEGALRLNLHDEWFPIVEAGYGKADRYDEVTQIYYSTSAPCMVVCAMVSLHIRWTSPVQNSLILSGSGLRAMASRTIPVVSIGLRPW